MLYVSYGLVVDSACFCYAGSQIDGGSISTRGSMISMAIGRRLLLITHWLLKCLEEGPVILSYCSLARASPNRFHRKGKEVQSYCVF